MNERGRRAGPVAWLAGTIVVAILVHAAAVWGYPRLVMRVAWNAMSASADVNGLLHAPRPDASSRTVVRPSPDIVYSVCVYDLDRGQWSIRLRPPDSYVSVSLYAMNTDNFFTVNDSDIQGDTLDLRIVSGALDETPVTGRPVVVKAPGRRGIALVRFFAGRGERAEAIEAARRTLRCAPAARGAEMLPAAGLGDRRG